MVKEELNLRSVLHIWLSERDGSNLEQEHLDGVAGIVSMRWWGVNTDTLAEDGRHMHAYLEAEGNLGLREECLWW